MTMNLTMNAVNTNGEGLGEFRNLSGLNDMQSGHRLQQH